MSGDPEQEYFSDSLTDEIISRLSKNSRLFVISRNSTFTYKGKAVKAPQVGRELGVQNVLEGSVLRAGDRIRVTAQLIDATTEGHLWSGTYERELMDIFTVQAEIAQQIAAALRVAYTEAELTRVRHIPTEKLTARDAFWRGYDHCFRLTEDDIAQAREYFERAIELDPNYADAYAMLAYAHGWDYDMGYNRDPQVLAKISDLSKKALALDDSLIWSHLAEGWLYWIKWQYQVLLAQGEKLLSLDPNNPWSYWQVGWALYGMGRYEEAIENIAKATQLDPHFWPFSYGLGVLYHFTGQYKDSVAAQKKAIALSPVDTPPTHAWLASSYQRSWRTQQNGNPDVMDDALAMAKQLSGLDESWGHSALARVYFYKKKHDLAIAEAEKAIAIQPELGSQYVLLAEIYGFIGRPEKALEMAEEAIQLGLYGSNPASIAYSQGHAYRMLGRLEEAIAAYGKCLNRHPVYHELSYLSRLGLAIAYAELGRMEEASAEAAEVLKLVPNFSVKVYGERVPYKDPAQAERDMAALRKVGLK